jgi:hypothetical protein
MPMAHVLQMTKTGCLSTYISDPKLVIHGLVASFTRQQKELIVTSFILRLSRAIMVTMKLFDLWNDYQTKA